MSPARLALSALALAVAPTLARLVNISNALPRFDVAGNYVDAHDGLIVEHNGTYFLYGEAYLNQTLATPYPWSDTPQLGVYTSPDLLAWTYRGNPLPDAVLPGTKWIPNVWFDEPSGKFIMWLGAGAWDSATSTDGISFTPVHVDFGSRFGAADGTDGTGAFIDDDGTGYVVFAVGGQSPLGHVVSIERMAPDRLSSSRVNVSGFFPDDYVESPALFKRGSTYYVTYGSCCCGCRGGGGIVVFTAPSVLGPWTRQSPWSDINCNNATAPICGAFGARTTNRDELVFHAQWWGVSYIPLADGSTAYLFNGRRWLSGPNVPDGCDDICGNNGNPGACVSSTYYLRSDFDVWYPLEFDDATGAILPLRPLDWFVLDLP